MDVYGDGCLPAASWVIFKVSAGSKSSEGVLRTWALTKGVCVRVWLWWSEPSRPPFKGLWLRVFINYCLPFLPPLTFQSVSPSICHIPQSRCLVASLGWLIWTIENYTPFFLYSCPVLQTFCNKRCLSKIGSLVCQWTPWKWQKFLCFTCFICDGCWSIRFQNGKNESRHEQNVAFLKIKREWNKETIPLIHLKKSIQNAVLTQ